MRGRPGSAPVTERRILDAIDAAASRGDAVLLPEAAAQGERFLAFLRDSPLVLRCELAGALRRRVETVDRLDVVIASPEPEAVPEVAAQHPAVMTVLERRATDGVLRLADGLPIHVRAVTPDAFAPAWVHATGSDAHRTALAGRGLAAGVTLEADRLRRHGRTAAAADEAAVYRAFDLAFIPPELREGAGEIEAAADGPLPDDLVVADDVQGALHCHTVYSDGRNTIEEMARAAEALGMRYLTITDHSPTATYAGGLTVDRLRRQWEEIARVQERVGIVLLRGTESDILRDGALDFPTPCSVSSMS